MLPLLLATLDGAVSAEVLTRAAEHRDWWTFALSTLSLAVLNVGAIAALRAGLRRYPFFQRGLGARVLTLGVGVLEGLVLMLAGGVPVERAFTQALIATATASGGRSWKPKRRRAPAVAAPTQESTP